MVPFPHFRGRTTVVKKQTNSSALPTKILDFPPDPFNARYAAASDHYTVASPPLRTFGAEQRISSFEMISVYEDATCKKGAGRRDGARPFDKINWRDIALSVLIKTWDHFYFKGSIAAVWLFI